MTKPEYLYISHWVNSDWKKLKKIVHPEHVVLQAGLTKNCILKVAKNWSTAIQIQNKQKYFLISKGLKFVWQGEIVNKLIGESQRKDNWRSCPYEHVTFPPPKLGKTCTLNRNHNPYRTLNKLCKWALETLTSPTHKTNRCKPRIQKENSSGDETHPWKLPGNIMRNALEWNPQVKKLDAQLTLGGARY